MRRYLFVILLFVATLDATSNFTIGYFEDRGAIKSIETIKPSDFNRSIPSRFSLGYRNKSDQHWFVIDLDSKSSHLSYLYFTNLFAKSFTFYYQDAKGRWQSKEAGYGATNRSRDFWTSKPTLSFDPRYNSRIYVKIQSDVAIVGEFLLFESLGELIAYQSGYYLFFALFFGVLLMAIGIGLLLFITLRERIYGYYVGYLLFSGTFVFMVNSLHSSFATPEIVALFRTMTPVTILFYVLFIKELLAIKKIAPRLNLLFNILLLSMLFFMVMLHFSIYPWYRLLVESSSILYLLLFIATGVAIYHRIKHAKLFLLAFVLNFITSWMMSSMYSGLLENNDLNQYGFMLMAMLVYLFFTLLLANRLQEETQEKLRVEEELLAQQARYTHTLQAEVESRTQTIHALLEEKEALLKEVYHRVKNNFHMVMSLLWMEESKQASPRYQARLKELGNRIKSMSLIHGYLLKSNQYQSIEVESYIEQITEATLRSYEGKPLFIECEIDSFELLPDEALWLGIILNELLTNAIKYHPFREPCRIWVACRIESRRVALEVRDNGEGFDRENHKKGFGMGLISDFAKKLHALESHFEVDNGTIYRLVFEKVVKKS
jgi:two-component sensor histidine kinase